MPYRTLEEQRSRLRTRLGYSAQNAAAGSMAPMLNDILIDAQVKLYWTHDWARLRKYDDTTVGAGQCLIDYPTDCNPERVRAISTLNGTRWSPPLRRGIAPQDYTIQDNEREPTRWEPYAQIELWPKADQEYTVRVFYVKNLLAFTQDTHRSTIDDDLIFQVALGMGKAHYRHPDAEVYLKQAETLLTQLKAKSWGKTVFNANDYAPDEEPLAKPVVV